MTLSIDSHQLGQLLLALDEQQVVITHPSVRDQDILLAIEELLAAQGVGLSAISAIRVHTGPGAFTSLRVGIAIAQTLAWSLGVEINGLPPGSSIDAVYGKEPSITISTKL